jgi:hypothetical protein
MGNWRRITTPENDWDYFKENMLYPVVSLFVEEGEKMNLSKVAHEVHKDDCCLETATKKRITQRSLVLGFVEKTWNVMINTNLIPILKDLFLLAVNYRYSYSQLRYIGGYVSCDHLCLRLQISFMLSIQDTQCLSTNRTSIAQRSPLL